MEDQWQTQWDFSARNLNLSQGNPSQVGWNLQPRINRLDFFGFIGSFDSQNSDRRVGFANISSPCKGKDSWSMVTIDAQSSTPDIHFRLYFKTREKDRIGNYQISFRASSKRTTLKFKLADAKFYKRGVYVATEPYMAPEKIEKIGFLVTRSDQNKAIASTQKPEPFQLSIFKIKFTDL